MVSQPRKLNHPFELALSRQFLFYKSDTYEWKPLPLSFNNEIEWTKMPTSNAKEFYIIKNYSSSRRTQVFLACTESIRVCVIKFFSGEEEAGKKKVEEEKNKWNAIYPQYEGIREVILNKKSAIILPHFDNINDRHNEEVLAAIEKTLREDYYEKGWYHGDVAWRNIGIRRKEGVIEAVVFDMESVEEISDMNENEKPKKSWVKEQMEKLKE